jgi:hypothetical protein
VEGLTATPYVRRRADQGEAAQDLEYLRSVRANRVLSWLGLTALSVGPYGTIGRHPGFPSVRNNTAGRCRIAGMTQPITAQASGHRGPTHLEVVMRMLLKAVLDTETANERVNERLRGGASGAPFERLRELVQPEAFYLFTEDGQRAFFAVFDVADASQIPAIIEPLFLRGKAKVTVTPCLTVEDADKAMDEVARRMGAAQG